MGMYDDIKYEMACPKCGEKLDSFQSKDGSCELKVLEFWEVDNFYDMCDNCNTWVEFNLRPNIRRAPLPIDVYEMKLGRD